jgi:hypothetical protein
MTKRREPAEISAAAEAEADFADRRADVEVDAHAKAEEIRYLERPRTRIRVTGTPEARAYEFAKKENLPDPVDPGQTYRDVRVRRRVGGRLAPDR